MQESEHPVKEALPVDVLDLHLAVMAVKDLVPGKTPESVKPFIYGTAFPILPGLFATAGHVLEDAAADGVPILAHIRGSIVPQPRNTRPNRQTAFE